MATTTAMRDAALLMPEAAPWKATLTELMTTVVSGATLTAMPSPRTTMAGKKVVQ